MAAVPRPPSRIWIWTAATVALVVVAALLWRGSDAAATTHSTAGPAPAASGSPAAALTQRWSAEGDPVPDPVLAGGRVLLGSPHGMRALDPATGREAWHYTRANATLCGLTATDGVVVATFRAADRCDEVVALRAGTGGYAWTRNVDLRGDATLSSAPQIVVATSPTGLLTLDPVGDNDRWRYRPPEGCRIEASRPGTDGVAVLERCSARAQVRLLDLFTGNPRWTHDLGPADPAARLLGADRLVGVGLRDSLQLLATSDGAPVATVPAADGSTDGVQQLVGDVVLVWRGGTLSAVDVATGMQLWQRAARGVPAAPAGKTLESAASVLVPEDGGFVRRELHTGAELGRSTAGNLPEGGAATQVGPVVVYRLPDRVLAYG